MKNRIKLGLICIGIASSLLTSCVWQIPQDKPPASNSLTSGSSTNQGSSDIDTSQPEEKVILILKLEGGSLSSPVPNEYNKGDTVTIPDPTYQTPTFPIIYTFDGWINQNNEKVTSPFIIHEDTTLTATWKQSKATVTVNLDSDGGVVGETQKVIQLGENFTLPVPTKQGYHFLGWFDGSTKITDESGHSLKTFESPESVTLKAHWDGMGVTVTLDYEGGTGDNKTHTIKYGESFSLPVPKKTGYIFNGWYNGNTPITDQSGKGIDTWNFTNTTTLKANYTLQKINLDIWIDGIQLPNQSQYDITMNLHTLLEEEMNSYEEPVWGWYKDEATSEYVNSFEDLVIDSNNHAKIFAKKAEEFTVVDGVITKADNTKMPMDLDLTHLLYKGKGITEIGVDAFDYCTNIKTLKLPDSLTAINKSAFTSCTSLKSINIPEKISLIDANAFTGCSSLTSIIIPNTSDVYLKIGASAFLSCTNLVIYTSMTTKPETWSLSWNGNRPVVWNYTEAKTEESDGLKFAKTSNNEVTIVGYDASITGTNVIIPSAINGMKVTAISSNAFQNSSIIEITIPSSVTRIGERAFYNCKNLSTVDLGEGLITLEREAFMLCQSITSIKLPSTLMNIGASSFQYCVALTSIVLPDGITTLGDSMFYGCSALSSVTLPKSLKTIGNATFYNCKSLKSINIPSTVVSLEESVFEGCSQLESANIPEGVTELKKWLFRGCTSLKVINLPKSLQTIGYAAFGDCQSLTSLELPEGLTTIDSFAFSYNSGLSSIHLPSTLTSIGESAFNHCSSLTTIFIPKNVVQIGEEAFNGCSKLTINCEIAKPEGGTPAGWSSTWNPTNCLVNWGQKA